MRHQAGSPSENDLPYRSLFENLRYGTAYCQLLPSADAANDFMFLDVNETLRQKAGRDSLTGKWASTSFPSLAAPLIERIDLCRQVVKTGRPQQFEVWLDDPRQCLSVSLFPAGGQDRFMLFLDDITSRKATELSLTASQNLLTKISEQVPGMPFQLRLSAQGRFSFDYVGPGVVSILEILPDDLKATPSLLLRRLHPEDTKAFLAKARRALTGDAPFHDEFRVVLAQRGLRWLRAESVPERQQDGGVLWHGLLSDITDEREAKIALEESKKFLENIINAVADPIFVKDSPGGPLFLANNAFCTLVGITPEELVARGGVVDFPEHEKTFMAQIDEQVFATGMENSVQETMTDRQGKVHTVITKKTLYCDDRGHRFLVGVIQDVTDRLKSEEIVLRSQKLESLGTLAGAIAHDFNNILATLFAYLELTKGSVANGAVDKTQYYLEKTLSVFGRAKALTQQLLTFSKGGSPLLQSQNLADLVRTTTDAALTGTKITPEYKLAGDLWTCECDRSQMTQMITNLVTNASHAMPEGGVVTVSAVNKETDQGPFIQLTIRDRGTGIPREHLNRIFDPFFSTKKNGHGLGLAAVHSIVLRHGGWVDVESEPHQGTTFFVHIPATPAPEPDFQMVSGPHRGYGRILLMDDEELLREAIRDMLQILGYEVTVTQDGAEALTEYRGALRSPHPFVAAILDLTIPLGMGGVETALEIRKLHPEAVLIAASGYADDPVMAHPKAHGFTERIVKPFLRRDLEDLLNRIFPLGPVF